MTVNPKFHSVKPSARDAVRELNSGVPAPNRPGDMNTRVHAPRTDRGIAVACKSFPHAVKLAASLEHRKHNVPLKYATPAKGPRVDSKGRTVFFI